MQYINHTLLFIVIRNYAASTMGSAKNNVATQVDKDNKDTTITVTKEVTSIFLKNNFIKSLYSGCSFY